MDHDNKILARNIYKEYRQTRTKIGEEAANAQYIHGQANQYFLLIVDFFLLQTIVATTSGNTDRTQLALRPAVQFLSSESFLQGYGQYIADALDCYEELEHEIASQARQFDERQQVFRGFIYLPTRCIIIKTIIKHRPLEFDQIMDYLLKSLQHLPTKHALYLSDTVYAMVETQPQNAHRVRYKLSELRILPSLVIHLTVAFCNDDYVDFLNGVFNLQPSWFLQQSSTSGASLTKIKTSIIQELSDYIDAISTSAPTMIQEQPPLPVNITAIIRALCGLVAFFGVKMTDQEIQQCLFLMANDASEK
ncbi:hypothetical protein BCR42DRAFT_225178 [Absidia repens]|uniref:Uncharacterized protein n=1 Tax=Absidia repens TaxID=90262 RepID=A0A1X2IPC2_9FUNG|nr:hypothetical protein BCR42DRAFT_225178 [Absidia repens]